MIEKLRHKERKTDFCLNFFACSFFFLKTLKFPFDFKHTLKHVFYRMIIQNIYNQSKVVLFE